MTFKKAIKLGFKKFDDGEWRRPVIQKCKDGRTVHTWTHYFSKKCKKCLNKYLASNSWQDFCSGKCSSTGRPSALKGMSFIREGSYGGRRISSRGYVEIYMPGHQLADKRGRVAEHRLIMFNALNGILEQDKDVHHINGIKN